MKNSDVRAIYKFFFGSQTSRFLVKNLLKINYDRWI